MKHTILPSPAIVSLVVCLTILVGARALPAAGDRPTYRLPSARAAGTVDHVAVKLEVGGEVKEMAEGKLKRMKMTVDCNLVYDERTLAVPDAARQSYRSLRDYGDITAAIKVDTDEFKPVLRPSRRLVGVTVGFPTVTVFSPKGSLTRNELELIDILGNSLMLDALLPAGPVAIGDSWKPGDKVVAAMLGLDEVTKSDLQSNLAAATETSAKIEMAGTVSGKLNGAASEIEVKAKYRYNFATRRIDWFGLLVKEQGEIGPVKRGVDATARLQVTITPSADAKGLSDAAVKEAGVEPSKPLLQLACESAGDNWEFAYDRCWYMTAEHRDVAVLRMVEQGEMVAQCNVSSLAKLAADKEVPLSEFQEDVKRALGENFGEFVQASQFAHDAGYRVFRVVVDGAVSQVPIQWHYYLVMEPGGRRVIFAFAAEAKMLERLGDADGKLVRSFRFR